MSEVIAGMHDFENNLKELDRTVRTKILIDCAKAGAVIVLDDARADAPQRTGNLARGMTTKVSRKGSDSNEATVDVGPDRRQFYGMFAEFGTVKQAKDEFLLPALNRNRERILQVMREKMLELLERFNRGTR